MDRGEFEIVLPPAALRPFARRYLYGNRKLDTGLTLRAKPTGYAYVSNFFGDICGDWIAIDGRRFDRASRWFLFGQIADHDAQFYHAAGLQFIAVEFTATAPHRLLGLPGARIFGLATALEQAAPDAARIARENFTLGADAPRDAHIAEINAFIARLAARALPANLAVEQAVSLIEAANGAVRIADVCAEIGVGARSLNRNFTSVVGLSPKAFAQILQINWVVGLLYANDTARLAEIAQDAGFYDQAHFNRAMQRFFREGPREFLKSDHPAFRTFLAESRRYGPNAPDIDES